jgi:hypothetical protein
VSGAVSFFVSTASTTPLISSVDSVFARLLALAGIRTPAGRPLPCVHDLRHDGGRDAAGLVPLRRGCAND